MSNMLGRAGPYDPRTQCGCKKHGGKPNMTPKRQRERRDWEKELAEHLEDDLDYSGYLGGSR